MSAYVFVWVMLYCGTFSRYPLKAEAVGWLAGLCVPGVVDVYSMCHNVMVDIHRF